MFSQNDCEGAGEAFSATCSGENFFGDIQKPFLPVSAQLHLEAMSRFYQISFSIKSHLQLKLTWKCLHNFTYIPRKSKSNSSTFGRIQNARSRMRFYGLI